MSQNFLKTAAREIYELMSSEDKGNIWTVFFKYFREIQRLCEATERLYFLSIQTQKKLDMYREDLFFFQHAANLNYTFEMDSENLL